MAITKERAAQRSLRLDLFSPDDVRQHVLDSVRLYRACCRQCYATLLNAQVSGADLTVTEDGISLKPNGERSKLVLALALDHAGVEKQESPPGARDGKRFVVRAGAALGYEMREYFLRSLWPTALSFVWDSARRDVTTVWQAKDPEHTRAARGWLAMQGARGVAQFMRRGIGFPIATARPKFSRHEITLKWDRDLGPVEFRVGKLDAGRYYPWKCLVDGDDGWTPGTLYLSERDGLLFATVTYARPLAESSADLARRLTVLVAGNTLTLTGPDGEVDVIAATDVLAQLVRLRRQAETWEARRESVGAKSRPWGNRRAFVAVQDHLSRLTLQRTRQVADANHAWTRRIAARAAHWRCGTVEVIIPEDSQFGGESWPWSQWRELLRYKLEEVGAVMV